MVGDAVTKECLVNYCLPTTYLVPHHQYHLELLMVRCFGITNA